MYSIEEFDKIKTKILKYVLYKKRTEKEIRLKFREENQDMLDDAIEYLKEAKYIDDMNYIERSINEFMNLKNLSKKEIEYKLMSKGIDKNLLETYMIKNSESIEEYEKESAKKIAIKKHFSGEEIENIKQMLIKKGYQYESINEAIDELEDI